MIYSRRMFIQELAAMGGTSLALAGLASLGVGLESAHAEPPKLSGRGAGTKVVILGAGLAGMTAAYELTKAGYDCQIIEARDIAGGRCKTGRKGVTHTDLLGQKQECDFDDGLYINVGPWRIPYHHRSTLHYTKLFGVPLESFVNDNDASYVYFEGGSGPLSKKAVRKGQIAADTRGYANELLAKCVGKGNLDAPLMVEDRDRFVSYLINEGRLSPLTKTYEGTDGRGFAIHPGAGLDPGPGKPSTPFSLHDILTSDTWRVLTSVTEYDMQRTMFQPTGGMDHIAQGFVRNVGSLIRYNTEVQKIAQDPNGVEVFYKGQDGTTGSIKAAYCICTIPLSVLKGIDLQVTEPFKAAMSGVSYAVVNKIGLQMKRRFWEEDHHIYGGHVYNDIPGINSISFPSTGWQSRKGVLLGYYGFGAEGARISAKSPAERAAIAVAAGMKVFPEYAENYEKSFSYSWHLGAVQPGRLGRVEPGKSGQRLSGPA